MFGKPTDFPPRSQAGRRSASSLQWEPDVYYWLDAAALLAGNLAQAIQIVQQGLAGPEHAEFVARLQQAHGQLQAQAPQA